MKQQQRDLRRSVWRPALAGAALCVLAVASNGSLAQEAQSASAVASAPVATPDDLATRYPTDSIQSMEIANRALADVEQQRAALDQKYAAEQHACYAKFFVTPCVDAAKESRRQAIAKIHRVEVEANAYIRGARVVERDKHLAEKSAENARNPPKPVADPTSKDVAPVTGDHAANVGEQRVAAHDAKQRKLQQEEAANAQKRADAVAAYNKKVSDAAARQHDVAEKKAEKEKQAAAKAAASSSAASSASAPKP